MQFRHASAEFVINEDHPLAARHARGVVIRCTAGQVWITVAGHGDDIFLAAGDSWLCPGDGLLLIDALNRAQVTITAPANRMSRYAGPGRHWAQLWHACRSRWPAVAGRRRHPA